MGSVSESRLLALLDQLGPVDPPSAWNPISRVGLEEEEAEAEEKERGGAMAPDPEAAAGGQAEPPDEEEDDPDVDEVDPTGRYLRVRTCSAAAASRVRFQLMSIRLIGLGSSPISEGADLCSCS